MVKVKDQDIPSEDDFSYSSSLRRAVDHPTLSRKYGTFKYGQAKYGSTFQSVQRRYPFRQPYKQSSSPRSPTAAQRAMRGIFIKCKSCFKAQPKTGGATPPALGPRNREYWYTSSGGSGLFYYDYFMQQTLDTYVGVDSPAKYPFTEVIPNWCKVVTDGDSTIRSQAPNSNYGSNILLTVLRESLGGGSWSYAYALLSSAYVKYTSLRVFGVLSIAFPRPSKIILEAYKIVEPWAENAVTWNNQPAVGPKIGEFLMYDESQLFTNWDPIDIPLGGDAVNGVELRLSFVPNNHPDFVSFQMRSSEHFDPTKHPLFIF